MKEKLYAELFNKFGMNENSMPVNAMIIGLCSPGFCLTADACKTSISEFKIMQKGLQLSKLSKEMKDHWMEMITASIKSCKQKDALLSA